MTKGNLKIEKGWAKGGDTRGKREVDKLWRIGNIIKWVGGIVMMLG